MRFSDDYARGFNHAIILTDFEIIFRVIFVNTTHMRDQILG